MKELALVNRAMVEKTVPEWDIVAITVGGSMENVTAPKAGQVQPVLN